MEIFSNIFSNNYFVKELSIEVIFFRLLLAVIFGGLVGFERERKNKPAGFRTYILVCFGAAIVSMIQDQLRIDILYFSNENFSSIIKTDLGRLGAQVISGIGFIGAGCIIKERGEILGGMTTAAGIWATACVGLGIGWGFYNIAIMSIIFIIFIMTVLKKFEDKFIKKNKLINFEIITNNENTNIETITNCYKIFNKESITINRLEKSNKNNIIIFETSADKTKNISEIIIKLSADKNIISVKEIS